MFRRFFVLLFCLFSVIVLAASVRPVTVRAQVPPDPPNPQLGEAVRALRQGQREGTLPAALPSESSKSVSKEKIVIAPWYPDPDLARLEKLVYQVWTGSDYDLAYANGDGSNPVVLTARPENDIMPRFNRDASRVVYSAYQNGNPQIAVINADRSGDTIITSNGGRKLRPDWSPDNQKIVFSSNLTGNYEVFTINADGSGLQQLTHTGDYDEYDPSYSPDGSRIAYVIDRRHDGTGFLAMMASDGSQQHDVRGEAFNYLENPTWSPDGQYIAADYGQRYDGFFSDPAVFKADGSNYSPMSPDSHTMYEDHVVNSWSPDGRFLLYNEIRYVLEGDTLYVDATLFGVMSVCRLVDPYSCSMDPTLPTISAPNFAFMGDWQSADIYPPTTRIVPLPAFSRASGFGVSWETRVDGVAAFAGYELQYRDGINGQWQDYDYSYSNTAVFDGLAPFAYFTGNPGTKRYFRLSAYDEALNHEPWPTAPDYDAATWLYSWRLGGQVTDNRDHPVVFLPITVPNAIQPITVGKDGRYMGYMNDPGDTNLNIAASGFGALPETPISFNMDVTKDIILPPIDNRVQNGGFETRDTSGWIVGGTLPTGVSSESRQTGSQGLALGTPCNPICTQDEAFLDDPAVSFADFLVTPDGTAHFLAYHGQELDYQSRSPDGTWSPIEVVCDPGQYFPPPVTLAKDNQGILYALIRMGTNLLVVKKVDGTWTTPQSFTVWMTTAIVAPDGTIHAFGSRQTSSGHSEIFDRRITPSGDIMPDIIVGQAQNPSYIAVIVGEDASLHVFWSDNLDIYYRQRYPDGTWSPVDILWNRYGEIKSFTSLLMDGQGTLHLAFKSNQSYYYMYRLSDGSWSEPVSGGIGILALGSDNLIASLSSVYDPSTQKTQIFWRYHYPGNAWSTPALLTSSNLTALNFDSQGRLVFVTEDLIANVKHLTYHIQSAKGEAGTASIEQTISLPADMHHPTLSFHSQIDGILSQPASTFTVSLVDGEATTEIYRSDQRHPWQQDWVALDAWAGKTITLRFVLQQLAWDPNVKVNLDDITVGSWLTPVIQSVSPAISPVYPPDGRLTIMGENFLPTPSVTIGAVVIPPGSVSWINANQIEVILPAHFPPGIHDIQVTNPGGQTNFLLQAFRFGTDLFLPFASRH